MPCRASPLTQGVDYHAMALAQDNNDVIIHLRNDQTTAIRFENVRLNLTTSLLSDTSAGVQRPLLRCCFGVTFSMTSMDSLILETARHGIFSCQHSTGPIYAVSWVRACVPLDWMRSMPPSSPSSYSHFYVGSMYDDIRLHVAWSYTPSPFSRQSLVFDIILYFVQPSFLRSSSLPSPLYFIFHRTRS